MKREEPSEKIQEDYVDNNNAAALLLSIDIRKCDVS